MVKMSSDRHPDKKLISSVTDTHTEIIRPVKSFVLKASTEFSSRSLSVFNGLNALEKDHSSWMSKNETHEPFELQDVPQECTKVPVVPPKAFDNFKKPFAPGSRKRKNNFVSPNRNMKKWIQYSLKDIPISSDATNTAVAFQFLSELRKRKEENANDEISSSEDEKVVFRKPSGKRNSEPNSLIVSSSSSVSTSSTRRQSQRSQKTTTTQARNSNFNIKLDHLEDRYSDY